MSLTLEKLHRLRAKGFHTLYQEHDAKWDEMVENAKEYAKTFIGEAERVRPGDVADVLHNAIKVDPDFENHVKTKGLQQKYWVAFFADYVLEQSYPPPEIA
ncbi:MAG TPA: hypothetical protein VHF01_13120 [Candidatus Acidoferrum sp.]|nr:hypothetical protein [Candidatus Acidoferrum sp.]